jgi:Glycosyltransferase family 87
MRTEAASGETLDRPAARGIPWLLLVVVAVTRIGAFYLADHPESYGTLNTRIVGDVEIYKGWADAIAGEGRAPYSEVAIEYPPAVLPFALAPTVGPDSSYRTLFIASMVMLDLAGLAGITLIGRRRGSRVGMWVWAAGVPLIGPILYLRLDLIPAVATIWAFERSSADSPAVAGGWMGLGFVAKIYPIFLLPVMAIMTRHKWRVVAGAGVIALAFVAPFAGSLDALFTSVAGYHGERGLQIESVWGTSLLVAGHFGYDAAIDFSFGAFHVASAVSPLLKDVAAAAALFALGTGIFFAFKLSRRREPGLAAEVSFATLASILALGTVFSPQFMVWVLALAAVVACAKASRLSVPALAVLPLCALTQLIYPFNYDALVFQSEGELVPQLMILARDLGVLAIGISAFWILARGSAQAPHDSETAALDGGDGVGRAERRVGS